MARSRLYDSNHPQAGKNNPNWKGGRTVNVDGYVLVLRPDHPDADVRGYVYEHRLVAEEKIGRRLLPGEEAHHDNEIRNDNRPDNITVKASHAEHLVEHRSARNKDRLRMPGAPNPDVECACGCGSCFKKYDGDGRPRLFVSGHNIGRNDLGQFAVR